MRYDEFRKIYIPLVYIYCIHKNERYLQRNNPL